MSHVSSTATPSTIETVFATALKEYKKQTKRDIASHPLVTQLESCDSPSAIIAVLRSRVQKLDQSQCVDEKWMKWVDPTVNVLYAFSATLGGGVGQVIPRRYAALDLSSYMRDHRYSQLRIPFLLESVSSSK